MKTIKPILFILASIFLFIACQKEYSVENGNTGALAAGTLKDTSGNCQDIVINGNYTADSALNANNYVIVNVNITSPGVYKISTDLQNGISFQDSGFIATTGLQSIKLKGTGTPILGTTTNFQVSFGTSMCLFSINVTGTGSGGGGTAATYTLTPGTGGNCSNFAVQGTYTTGTQLNSSNKIILQVNVTKTGTYSINTGNVNGMTFIGVGNFTSTGAQTVTLQGGGTPNKAGSNVIPVNGGGSNCSFTIAVVQGTGSGGSNPNSSDSAWSFTQGSLNANGQMDFAYDTLDAVYGYLLVLSGGTAVTGDSAMTIAIRFPTNTITAGTHSTSIDASFSYDDYRNATQANPNPVNIYQSTPPNGGMTVTILTWDPVTRIVTGTFSGPAKNATGTTVNVTVGKFKALVE